MKQGILATIILGLLASSALAVDPNWIATPSVPIVGSFGPAKAYTFTDNTAVLISTMYVTGWTRAADGFAPIGAMVSVETQDARFSCGGGTPTTSGLGHLMAAGSSMMLSGDGLNTCKFIPKTAGSYPLVQLTPIYSK